MASKDMGGMRGSGPGARGQGQYGTGRAKPTMKGKPARTPKPSSPVQKLSPAAAARVRAKMYANARMRKTLMTPGDVRSGVVTPTGIGGAIASVYRAAASRRTTAGMTPSQIRRANVDPKAVERKLAALERRTAQSPAAQRAARAAAIRLERNRGARMIDKADDAARKAEVQKRNPNKMVPKPSFSASNSRRLAERKDALNSPTREGYRQPAGGAKETPREAEMRGRSLAQPAGESRPESMRFTGKDTREGYKAGGKGEQKPLGETEYPPPTYGARYTGASGAPDGVRSRVKVPRKPKPTAAVKPRRTQESRPDGTDRYGNRPGMTDAERIEARKKWREEQAGKPAKPKAPTRQEMEANKAAIAEDRIRPVPSRPKTKVSTKIKAEEERVSRQNPRAAEREAKAKADAAKPRIAAEDKLTAQETSNLARRDDIAARRAAADERLRKDLASRKKGSRKP